MNYKIEDMVFKTVRVYRKFIRDRFDSEKVKNILVLRIDHLGDMICTSPFIRELRKNYPKAQIDLLCSKEVYNYIELSPYVNTIIKYDKPEMKNHVFGRTLVHMYRFVKENLRNKNYDIVFTPECPTSPAVRIFANFIQSKKVISILPKDKYFEFSDSNFIQTIFPYKHEVETGLSLLESINCHWDNDELELWADDADRQIVQDLLMKENIRHDVLTLVLFLSTSAAYKDWAVENYACVAKKLQQKYGVEIILLGAKNDTEAKGKQFMALVPKAHNLIGKTTIRQTGVVIRQADVYLGGDTGTLHLAAACKIPGVVVTKDYEGACGKPYGTLMDRFFPWKAPIKVIRPQKPLPGCENGCQKSYAHCINQIEPAEVFSALCEIIDNKIDFK